ncbi:hypothetical protein LguiA_033447 [Lonicera macranthoides]
MAEELQYASAPNKRKYEDPTTPPSFPRRTTGFSAPISSSHSPPDSDHAPPSYSSAPPPVDEIELAKQRAQEIAARLFSNAESKRTRVDNGGGGGGGGGYDSYDSTGFGSAPSGLGQKPMFNMTPSMPTSYGYPGASKKIEIPNGRVGVIIGKAGETIKYLQLQSGARIQVTRDMDADPNSPTRGVELMGTPDQIAKAEQLINDVLVEAESGGSGIVSRRITGQQGGAEQFVMKVPNNKVGLIIGKGGETIKNMQARSGARIQVIPLHLPPGDTSTERTVQIDGSSEQIETAKQLVNEVISEVLHETFIRRSWRLGLYLCIESELNISIILARGISFALAQLGLVLLALCFSVGCWILQLRWVLYNRLRNAAMGGGYPQQGYQAQPPTNWAPSGQPMHQPGYGYVQPGAYPSGPSPQYNMPQQPYPSSYPQQPTSGGGYPSSWDPSTTPQTQQTTQLGGYNYYNQQQTPLGPTDITAYGYNQQGQGYTQYSASTPQSGYGQLSQANPLPGYDQQQGYSNSTPGYSTPLKQTPGGQTPPPYNTSQQSSPNPSYPIKGTTTTTQPGYGVPPTSQSGYGTQATSGYGPGYGVPQAQKPPTQPAYAQPQQSPSVQPGYPHSQPPTAQSAYAQPDSGAPQQAPPSGYGTTASAGPGYAPVPYGAHPAGQPSYAGLYTGSYGSGGYSQPSVYSGDGNNARGTYDSAPASQTTQPVGVAKSSPQS